MANNEIKVTISANNKPFIEGLKQCTNEIKKFSQSFNGVKLDIGKIGQAEDALHKLTEAFKAVKGGQSISVSADVSNAMAALQETENALKSMQDVKVSVSLDKAQALADIEQIQQALGKITSGIANITVDNGQAVRAAEEAQQAIGAVKPEKVDVEIQSSGAMAKINKLTDALKELKGAKLEIKADGSNAEEEIKKITEAMKNVKSMIHSITVRVSTRGAIENIEKLIHAARQLRTELKDVKLPAGDSGAAAGLERVASLNRQILAVMKEISAESKNISANMGNTGGASESTLSKMGNLSLIANGVSSAFSQIKDLAAAIVMPGFNYTKEMEMSQLGIAGILQSMTLLNGQAVSFGDAMGISSDMMQKLQRDAIKTSATTEELVTTFRAVLAPGISAGMNLDEIQQFTTVGVNAVKAMGLDSTQFVQELRDLVQGGIQASSSTLATSLGITDEDIKNAKASSEGLFKFLMARLEGFAPMAAHFPNTLEGKLSQLKEVSTLASAEITETFKEDFKDIVGAITSMIADVDMKTGKVNFNPAILKFVDTLKGGVEDVLDLLGKTNEATGKFEFNPELIAFFDGLGDGIRSVWELLEALGQVIDQVFNNPAFSLVKDYWMPVLADLWSIVVDIVDMFKDAILVIGNLTSKVIEAVAPFQQEFSGAIMWAVEQLKEFVRCSKLGWDMLAKLSGGVQNGIDPKTIQDISDDSRELYKNPYKKPVNSNDLSQKFDSKGQTEAMKKAENERIKDSQKALKAMTEYLKNFLDDLLGEYDRQIKAISLQKEQNLIGIEEANRRTAEIEAAKQQAIIENLNAQIGQVNKTEYKDDSEKELKLNELNRKIKDATRQLGDFQQALAEINGTSGSKAASPEGTSWRRENAGVNIEGLDEKALQAIGLMGDYFKQETGRQMVVSSGKRDWGGHVTGQKFDVVDDMETRLLEKNVDGIRDKMIAFAHKIGVARQGAQSDEYTYPSARSTAGHLDFDAAGLGDEGQQVFTQELAFKNKQQLDALKKKRDEMLKRLNADHGDVSSVQLEELNKQIQDAEQEFLANGMMDMVDVLKSVKAGDSLKIRVTQTAKDLEYANADLVDTQEELFYDLTKGTKDSAQVTEEYTKRAHELLDGKLIELQAQLDEALRLDQKDIAIDIKKKMREVIDTISNGIKAILDKIDSEANREIEKIQMNKYMTRMQKDDAIDVVRQRANKDKVEVLQDDLTRWKAARPNMNKKDLDGFKDDHGGVDIDQAILEAEEKLEYLNYQLEQTPTLLDEVQIAGKQALEDGLLDFFTRGIMECESLGDAFRNLAITVLEAINRMYAEALVKNIMGALFPAQAAPAMPGMSAPSGGSSGSGFDTNFGYDFDSSNWWKNKYAEGGSVSGPGTGTSDSILAALSNGEFVINAKAVQEIGVDALHRINSGRAFDIPMPRFAMGGLVGSEGGVARAGMQAAAAGMNSFGANLSTSISPEITIRNTFNGEGFKEWVTSEINQGYQRNMREYAKLQSMISKKFR